MTSHSTVIGQIEEKLEMAIAQSDILSECSFFNMMCTLMYSNKVPSIVHIYATRGPQ